MILIIGITSENGRQHDIQWQQQLLLLFAGAAAAAAELEGDSSGCEGGEGPHAAAGWWPRSCRQPELLSPSSK
ncbi:hypothetical protein ACSSS7_003157 [Eimeria intestinalis]